MFVYVLETCTLMVVLILPLFYPVKKKSKAIRIPKNYNDTSDARYAVNANGYLEEIHNDHLSSHVQ